MSRGKKKAQSLSPEQGERLAKLYRLQAVYHSRGHDVTPVDEEIIELEKLGESSEEITDGT